MSETEKLSKSDKPSSAHICSCERCWDEQHPLDGAVGWERFCRPMHLCAICGNKRCPHATDHRNACTDSNEPGQPGSSFKRFGDDRDAQLTSLTAQRDALLDVVKPQPIETAPRNGNTEILACLDDGYAVVLWDDEHNWWSIYPGEGMIQEAAINGWIDLRKAEKVSREVRDAIEALEVPHD